MREHVEEISVTQLKDFKENPFSVRDDEDMQALRDSIQMYGILSPLLARPAAGEGYELISGHRRKAAALTLGLEKVPVLVRELSDDEATILMIDSNIQREHILPSEKAYAYKMKMEALRHQGIAASCKVCTKSRSDEAIAEESKVSARTIQNYIRLTFLEKPFLDLVDEQRIAFTPAVELSYLTKKEQTALWGIIRLEDCTPSLSQAVRLKKLSKAGKLTREQIETIMSEEKANQKERIRLEVDAIRKFFPRSYTPAQMQQRIMEMLNEQAPHSLQNTD